MGQITTWVEQYAQGLIDRDALVANLVAFKFQTPERFATIPADVFEAEAQAEERTYTDEDTLDELLTARDRGLLTREDLDVILDALIEASPTDD
jgi:hypothetical protein